MFRWHYILLLLFVAQLSAGQSFDQKKIEQLIANGNASSAIKLLGEVEPGALDPLQEAKFYYLRGKCYSKLNSADNAYTDFLQSRDRYRKMDSIPAAMDINLELAQLISSQEQNHNDYRKYLDEYMSYAAKTNDRSRLLRGYVQQATALMDDSESSLVHKPKAEKSLQHFWKAIAINKHVKDPVAEARINNNIAVLYNEILRDHDSSLYYLKKDYANAVRSKDTSSLVYNLINQAATFSILGNHQKSINLLLEAISLPVKDFEQKLKAVIYDNLHYEYAAVNDYQNALHYLQLSNQLETSINESAQNIAISDMQAKYRAKEKEVENLSLKNKLSTNNILMSVFVGLLLVTFIISVLGYKNISRKRKIAEQERFIEKQALEKSLKEQELNQIDLMLESQEKERQQIANEIHDNLGSILVTLKLNIESLRRSDFYSTDSQNILDRNDGLIDEAYQKVRDISHLKNLGVIGTHGLLAAVQTMAEKMTVINKLTINVFPFGLEERLDNQSEVTIFRMIQELCTNIIKHSAATEASIYLTQHNQEDINIIIEDNGRGFDPEMIGNRDGIGIANLEKKTRQMGGSFTIDSIIGKGTTIIINIPLNDNSSNSRRPSGLDRRNEALPRV